MALRRVQGDPSVAKDWRESFPTVERDRLIGTLPQAWWALERGDLERALHPAIPLRDR